MNYRPICHNITFIILFLTLTHFHTFPFGAVSKSQYQYEYLQPDGLHQQADGKPKQAKNRTAKTIKQCILFAVNAKLSLPHSLAMRMQSGSATFALVNLNMTCSSRCYKGPSGVTTPRFTEPSACTTSIWLWSCRNFGQQLEAAAAASSFSRTSSTRNAREKNTIKTNDDKFNMSVEWARRRGTKER